MLGAARHGMRDQDPAYSIFGEFASWANDPGWLRTTAAQRAVRAAENAGVLVGGSPFRGTRDN